VLEAVERQIERYVAELDDTEIKTLYTKLPRGKRLRAKLILTIAGSRLSAIKTAAIVEMIHAASLLHDDVIDDADMRRSKPSLNALYGNKTAIMLGDILYSKGFYELNDIDRTVAKFISDAVTQLSIGELKDVSLAKRFHTDKKAYEKMIYQKTASLIEAAAASAAYLAGKPVEPFRIYGRNLGLAFQMIDDMLDVASDSETLGKPAMHDFEEGKTTLPYIYLYDALDTKERKRLAAMHGKRLREEERNWIRAQMATHEILEKCYAQARELVDEAVELMQEQGETALRDIALAMIDREF
jgi:octaprenyl-diphosphate synthase